MMHIADRPSYPHPNLPPARGKGREPLASNDLHAIALHQRARNLNLRLDLFQWYFEQDAGVAQVMACNRDHVARDVAAENGRRGRQRVGLEVTLERQPLFAVEAVEFFKGEMTARTGRDAGQDLRRFG